MFKRILVPLDGSEAAEVVLPYVRAIAGRLDSDIFFLHVSSPDESQSSQSTAPILNGWQ